MGYVSTLCPSLCLCPNQSWWSEFPRKSRRGPNSWTEMRTNQLLSKSKWRLDLKEEIFFVTQQTFSLLTDEIIWKPCTLKSTSDKFWPVRFRNLKPVCCPTTKIPQGDKWNPSSLRGMTLMTSNVTFIFNGRLSLILTFTSPFSLELSEQTHVVSPLYDWSELSSAWQWIWRSAWGKFGNSCEHVLRTRSIDILIK